MTWVGESRGRGRQRTVSTSVLNSNHHFALLAKGPNSSAVSACARSFKPGPGLCPRQAISIFKAFCFGSMSTKLNLILSMVLFGKPSRLPRDSQTGAISADNGASTSAAGASAGKSSQSMPALSEIQKELAVQA